MNNQDRVFKVSLSATTQAYHTVMAVAIFTKRLELKTSQKLPIEG